MGQASIFCSARTPIHCDAAELPRSENHCNAHPYDPNVDRTTRVGGVRAGESAYKRASQAMPPSLLFVPPGSVETGLNCPEPYAGGRSSLRCRSDAGNLSDPPAVSAGSILTDGMLPHTQRPSP